MKSNPVTSYLFINNRLRLSRLMLPGAVALIRSGERKLRNGDQAYPFRQRSDFFYLTGISQDKSFFLFAPDFPDPVLREILFIERPTLKSELWTGRRPGPEQLRALSGIGQVRWLDERDAYLQLLIGDETLVYTDHLTGEEEEAGKNQYPRTKALAPLLQSLRMIKQPEEIAVIKNAVSITRSAFLRVLRKLEPGMYEYQVEAEIIGEFIGRGAEGHAFEPIVASGKNALVLHYVKNNCICRDGELLLMDFGAEVNYYASDCSRTIPVNGRFTPRQRQLYDAVLRVFRQARDLMMPGTLMADFQQATGELWEEEHISLGLYSRDDVASHQGTEPLWKNYFMHGTSHSMGLDVHDPFDRLHPFEPGMVFSCEPAIYIAEEGVGIRLENDILITEKGPVDLMEDIPMEADEIEDLMNQAS
ncbi:MAG: aminopeptidase P N-terminal domain-containing protein [Bacteroidales bacterium]|nr:aminopeptidase P N-terminal domain-containing protein [Bacteroidales bacterium]